MTADRRLIDHVYVDFACSDTADINAPLLAA